MSSKGQELLNTENITVNEKDKVFALKGLHPGGRAQKQIYNRWGSVKCYEEKGSARKATQSNTANCMFCILRNLACL